MKFLKTLILILVCLGLGALGGGYFGYTTGFEYGWSSLQSKIDHENVKIAKPVELAPAAPAVKTPAPAPPAATPAPTPAPAPVAAPAAPAPAATPAAPAPAAGNWNTVGTKTMSQQAVIDIPADEKPAAAAAPAAPAPAPAPAATPAPAAVAATPATGGAVYTVNNDDSTLAFVGYKEIGGEKIGMSGFFGGFSGTVTAPDDNPEHASFEVTVKTATLNTENAILTGVLKSSMFFDATTYPEAKLVSQKIVKQDDKYVATVAWTMRDKTIGYELPLTLTKSGNSVTATCEVFIDRNLWGVGPAVYENKEIGISMPIMPEVKVKFEMIAEKK